MTSTSFLKRFSILGLAVAGGCHAAVPYGYARGVRDRGALVSPSLNRVHVMARDVSSGCSLWLTAVEGDTCDGILVASDITLEQLIEWNPSLEDGICDELLVPDTNYCVGHGQERMPLPDPTTPSPPNENAISTPAPIQQGMIKSCTNFHFVEPGQGCFDIIPMYDDLTIDQLYAWNPAIGKGCTTMWAETYICVGVEGASRVVPGITITSTVSITTRRPEKPTTTSKMIIVPEGTTRGCQKWGHVGIGDTCESILSRGGEVRTTIDELFLWNPSLGPDCSGLLEKTYICIRGPPSQTTSTMSTVTKVKPVRETPTLISPGMTKNCIMWALVRASDTCESIISRVKANNPQSRITVADLFRWNRSIKPTCSDLVRGNYICVLGPGLLVPPVQVDTSSTTIRLTTTTTLRRQTSTMTIKLPTTTTASSANPDSTPSPIQPGTVEGCKKWAYVKDGQTCNDIMGRFPGLTLDMLVTWNPAIGGACTGLWARTYVCVRA
ncbi:hypothetical protein TWF730_001795 [Orbilia blumenaviensis]|uniref:LysM domain-containing protein n=1 Tax=Orbilia blumenaviensis TaxID=1796055 RepID=A0AAV9UC26_9PEZI